MKYLYQAGLIFLFTFLGEALARVVPFPIPAAIWGLLLMFLALCAGWLKPEQIRECGRFLILLLPVLFVAPTVDLMEQAQALLSSLPAVLAILAVPTLLTFLAAGKTTQWLRKRMREGE